MPPWPDPPAEPAFHGLAGRIVRAIEPHTEADPAALLVQLLVGVGNAVGRGAHFVADGARHHLNLFAVLVGQTAKGRKGTSWQQVRRLLESAQPAWAGERILSGLSSGEGLIWAVRDPIRTRTPVKAKGRFTGEYDEFEADPGVPDKRLLVMEGEFANVLKVVQREGNTLSPVVRLAWDTGDLRSMVKNNPAVATDAHVSIVGHVTRDELRRLLDATEAANGFANRFLWVCVRRSKVLPDGGAVHTVDFSSMAAELTAAIEFGRAAGELPRDAEARALWHAVYPELSEGRPGLLGAVTSRGEAQVMRLAAVYAVLDASPWVRATHLTAALALWEYCEASARHVFGDALGDAVADEVLDVLRGRGAAGATRTEIRDHFNRHCSSERLGRALATLAEYGLARRVSVPTDGRPAERWYAADHATEATDAERG